MKKTLLFLSFIIISALSYGQTNLVLNGTGDEHGTGSDSSNTSDNADAFDMTPNSTLNGDIVSPYRYNADNNPNGWYNSDLADWLETNCGDSDEQPGSTSDGSWDYSAGVDQGVTTRGLKINESCRRLYQLITVESGKEYTFSIESRSEAENVPSDIFMLNTEITSEDGLTSTSASVDHYFEITNDFNSSKSNATTNNFTLTTFDFTASTNKIVIYVRASAAVDSSNEVFYDNISLVEKTASSAGTVVTPSTATFDKGYMNAFNLDDSFAFGFEYPVADMKTTQTSTSVTLQPNFAIWTGEDGNAAWFDANPKTPNKYVEASSYTESSTAFNDNDLTFEGVVDVDDLDAAYTVNAFIKALDPNNGYATVVNKTVELTTAGQEFSVSATAAELTSGLIVQYGFSVVGPPADPANESTIGSVVVGEPATGSGSTVTPSTATFDKGYMNAFNLDDSFAFGFEYPVANMKTTQTSTSVTLQPNFAIWDGEDGNAAWFDASPKTPNKYVEASSYTESSTAFNDNDLTFEGVVNIDNLDEAYTVNAFIKALDPNNGYATVVNNTVELTSGGQEFSVSATAAELTTGLIVQYGFSVVGPPADPANESTLGSIVVGEPGTASTEDVFASKVSVYPNPANSFINISTTENISGVAIYNVIGKKVIQVTNVVNNSVDISSLSKGMYILKIAGENSIATKKIIKN